MHTTLGSVPTDPSQRGTSNFAENEASMNRLTLTLLSAFLIAVTSLVPTACSLAEGSLDGSRWKLVEWTISSMDPAQVRITADFAGGQLSGNSGVNSYSGPYQIGPGNAFSAGPLAGTLMAGPEPAMRAESAYLTLLGQAKSYGLANGKLTLYDQGGNESLTFEGASK
jgi:heat shock protein HslJ